MIYFIAILLFIFYIAIDVINYFSGRNISKISFFFSGFGILQLFLGILTLSQVSLAIYEPISYIVTTFVILLGMGYLFFFCKKKNKYIKIINNINISKKDYFIMRGFSWFAIIFIFIIQLFLRSPTVDSTYYVAISSNFANSGIYSTTGIDGELVPQIYLFPTSFFLYGTLFQDNIQLGYTIINRLLYLLFIFSTLSIIFDNSKIKKKNFELFLYFFGIIFSMLLFFYSFPTNLSGNLEIQKISIIGFFLLLHYNKNKSIALFMIPFGAAFFSSTAILIGPILIFSALVYRFIKGDYLRIVKYFPFLIIMLFFSIILFFNPVFNSIIALSKNINFLIIFYVIILLISGSFFLVMQFLENKEKIKKINLYQKLNNQKSFYFFIIMLIILPIIAIIFWWLIPIIQAPNSNINFYDPKEVLFTLFFSIILVIFTIKLWKNQRKIYDLAFTFVIFWTISIVVKVLLTIPINELESLNQNLSSWRILWTFIGFSLVDALFFLLVFSIHVSNNFSFFWLKKKYIIIYPLILSILPFAILINIPSVYSYVGLGINSNIIVNTKYLNNEEITQLKNIDFNNFSKSYVTTIPISPYLIDGVNLSQYIGRGIGWWYQASGIPNYYISNEDFKETFQILRNNLKNKKLIINSIRNVEILDVDYIFLDKRNWFPEHFFGYLNYEYEEILSSENIFILKKI